MLNKTKQVNQHTECGSQPPKIPPNDLHLVYTTSWIRAGLCDQQHVIEWWCVTSKVCLKALHLFTLVPLSAHSGGSQSPCMMILKQSCGKAHMKRNWGLPHTLTISACQTHEWATWKVDFSQTFSWLQTQLACDCDLMKVLSQNCSAKPFLNSWHTKTKIVTTSTFWGDFLESIR